MKFSVIIEKIDDNELDEGLYYAHIPSLGLTTHGYGIDGAKNAAKDLLELWIAEKNANNERIADVKEEYFSIIDIN